MSGWKSSKGFTFSTESALAVLGIEAIEVPKKSGYVALLTCTSMTQPQILMYHYCCNRLDLEDVWTHISLGKYQISLRQTLHCVMWFGIFL